MAQRLDRTSMSVLKCTSSPNPFATDVKDILSQSMTLYFSVLIFLVCIKSSGRIQGVPT